MLQIPIDTNTEAMVCNIKKNSSRAELLNNAEILIWDEISMMNRKYIEAVNRTLQDIRENKNLMGGLLVVLAGDFRQTLPVVKRGTIMDEINACLKSSTLWKYVQPFHLKQNMRVKQAHIRANEFTDYLLKIGNGTANSNFNNETIELKQHFGNLHTTQEELLQSVYPNLNINISNHQWISERAILAITNEIVDNINLKIMQTVNGEMKTYYAIDSIANEDEAVMFPQEFLNSLQPCGMPQYKLCLKIGIPIMLLRNLDPPKLCNGTRLIIKKLYNHVIEATIISGQHKGEDVLIPRIPLISNENVIEFKRLQFPIKIAFVLTINKSQGQSFNMIGIDLQQEVFSHGQLYVSMTRATDPENLHILTKDTDAFTKNIVYKQILN